MPAPHLSFDPEATLEEIAGVGKNRRFDETIDDVSVDVGSAHYDLWGPYPIVVGGKSSQILTQTAEFDFDTSEPSVTTCDPTGEIPLVHIVVGSRNPKTRTFTDSGQVLNTGGVDPGSCTLASEGHDWVRLHGHN